MNFSDDLYSQMLHQLDFLSLSITLLWRLFLRLFLRALHNNWGFSTWKYSKQGSSWLWVWTYVQFKMFFWIFFETLKFIFTWNFKLNSKENSAQENWKISLKFSNYFIFKVNPDLVRIFVYVDRDIETFETKY